MLFGASPADLPVDSVSATAIRALEEEDKRGLIAVDTHFYSTNRDLYVLDKDFALIGARAGGVAVPLGTPLGATKADEDPYRFTERARWANRYFTQSYVPALPAGGLPNVRPYNTDDGEAYDPPAQFPSTSTRSWEVVQQSVVCGVTSPIDIPDLVIPPLVYPPWTIENPPLTWVLQNGAIAPYNPTLYGAHVYDTHLQKWGVFKGNYKHFVDYQPVNANSGNSISYKNFLIVAGCLTEDLEVALFTDTPVDNFIKYGKYQHISSDWCALEEVTIDFHTKSTGMLAIQFSLDGRQPEYGHSVASWFTNALSHTLNCDIVGKWASVTITGNYDLSAMQIKSNAAGRR